MTVDKLFAVIASVPTTNLRIVVTLTLVVGTAVIYWLPGNWEPSWGWLTFLAAMSGLDVAQFAAKRNTEWEPKGGGSVGQ